MKLSSSLSLLTIFLIVSCSAQTQPVKSSEFNLYYDPIFSPWMGDMTVCATSSGVTLRPHPNIEGDAGQGINDIWVHYGEDNSGDYSYQIGVDDIRIILNPQNPVGLMDPIQVQDVFSGRISNWKAINGQDSPISVWVFPPGDVERIFEISLLSGVSVSPLANIATTPTDMLHAVATHVNSIGFITGRWLPAKITPNYSLTNVPVLLQAPHQPLGALREFIACLQK